MLLVVGVLLTATTLSAHAATVTVKARANGPIPTNPSVILSPKNNTAFSSGRIPVSGTCESTFFIRLYRNDIFSGSTRCTPAGTWSIVTDLFTGRNDLYVRTFNAANQEGPVSNTVTVYLIESGRANDMEPFYINTEYYFKAAYSGQKLTWDFNIFGGNSPYTAYVNWGDGYTDTLTDIELKKFIAEHKYMTQKEVREYYNVVVRVVDRNGREAQIQLIAIMNDPHIISGALVRPNDPSPLNPSSWFNGTLKGAWSAYGFIVIMGICFWLGERRGVGIGQRLANRRRARSS